MQPSEVAGPPPERHARLNSHEQLKYGSITVLGLAYAAWNVLGFLENSSTPILTLLCAIASLLLSAGILARQQFNPLSPALILLLFAQLYFAARFSLSAGQYGDWHAFAFICYILFLVGIYIVLQTNLFSVRLIRKLASYDHIRSRSRVAAITTAAYSCYVLLVLYLLRVTNDEFDPFLLVLRSLATRLAIAEQGLSPILLLAGFISTLGITGAFVLAHRYRSYWLLLLWVATLACMSMALGSRGQIVIPIFQLVIATAVCTRNYMRVLLWLLPPLIVAAVLFSTWFLSIREGGDGTLEDYSIFDRFDAYQNWLNGLSSDGIQFSFGESIPNAIAQFIPRSALPEKPYYFSTEMTRRLFTEAFNMGINLDFGGNAEAVYNFFLAGPFLFGIFIGWLCRILFRLLQTARQTSSPVLGNIYAQGVLLPASFFFAGWINSHLIFVCLGYTMLSILSIRLFCKRSLGMPSGARDMV
jgi:oligosaccharide repeat unit polymerase